MSLNDGNLQLTLEEEVQDLISKGAAIEMMALPDGEYNSQMFKIFKRMRIALILMEEKLKESRSAHDQDEFMWRRDYDRLEQEFREYRRNHPDEHDEKVTTVPVC